MDFFQAAQREAQWLFCQRYLLRLFVDRCDDLRASLQVGLHILGHFAEVGVTLRKSQAVDQWCQLGNGAARITRSLRAFFCIPKAFSASSAHGTQLCTSR